LLVISAKAIIYVVDNDKLKKKMTVGWWSFTCCEDSTILFTELLNDHFDEWKAVVDFKYVRQLKGKNSDEAVDVAFIEGAVASDKQAEEVKKIRAKAKYVVAIGACACTGLPSATRNEFTPDKITERIDWYMRTFDYAQKTKKLSEVIKVDDEVNGCPMGVAAFTAALTKYVKIINQESNNPNIQ
jgi:sulfhydrogenase subunit delta